MRTWLWLITPDYTPLTDMSTEWIISSLSKPHNRSQMWNRAISDKHSVPVGLSLIHVCKIIEID